MCYSFEVSISTYIFGMCVALYLLFYNKINYIYLLFPLLFVQIQLIEALIWYNMGNQLANYYLSLLGLLIIVLEPYFSIISYAPSNQFYILLVGYTLTIPFIYFANKKIDLSTTVGENGSLKWNWLNIESPLKMIIFAFFLLVPLLLSKNYVGFSFGLFILLMSLYYGIQYQTFGTYFCYWANIIWLYFFCRYL